MDTCCERVGNDSRSITHSICIVSMGKPTGFVWEFRLEINIKPVIITFPRIYRQQKPT